MSDQKFLAYLNDWRQNLPVAFWESLLAEYSAEQTAVISIDVVNGFTRQGNLSSPRIAAIVPSVVQLFREALTEGIRNFLLLQDNHPSDSKEFLIYPPHCIEGSKESQTVAELLDLSGSDRFKVLPKKTINPGIEEGFRKWMMDHSNLRQFILVGDCTDICVYLIAIFLKSWQVQNKTELQVVVPANCVDTYDIPVRQDSDQNIPPHPGDFLHVVFLYHMHLNGVRIFQAIRTRAN